MKTIHFKLLLLLIIAASCKNLSFVPGTYSTEAQGFIGVIKADVTFSEDSLKSIVVTQHNETQSIGDVALSSLIKNMIEANGTGVDAISGATSTSEGLKQLVNDAALKADVNKPKRFFKNKIIRKKRAIVEDTWDVVVIGGGGAGLFTAAQAAEDGNTVLIIEKSEELGGNTIISGGLYQSVDHHLVWSADDPEATETIGFGGKTVKKVKATVGCIDVLKTILSWSEKPFDDQYYLTHEFVAGDIDEQAKHGVHSEYIQTLRTLKQEISAYLAYAEPKLAKGLKEDDLTLFSTTNLHIFQSYYGGLRQSADKMEWIYSDYELLSQIIRDGEKLKPWLMEMGVDFVEVQPTLPGALWYRENLMNGCYTDADGDGEKEFYESKWGVYVMAPLTKTLNANNHNCVMRSTTAEDLIFSDGKVTGVNAVMSDGTKVIAHAAKGVVIASGGYAGNVKKVLATNRYWSNEYLTGKIGTTNRESIKGDGLTMAANVGAEEVGEGWTQLMPSAFAADGLIAKGNIDNAVFISPLTGRRFVDECAERDVLALEAFRNGAEINGTKGVFLCITGNLDSDSVGLEAYTGDIPGKEWCRTGAELDKLFKEIGVKADAAAVLETIRDYDFAPVENRQPRDVKKQHQVGLIGHADLNPDGSFNMDTYDLENTPLRIRLLAPSLHHTMGGLKVDVDRHVIDKNGKPIPGLFAAGEVTGGFFGGNRLGGNALMEIMVSGRIAGKMAGKNNQ